MEVRGGAFWWKTGGKAPGERRALCVFTVGAHRQGNILYLAGKPGKTRRKTAGTEYLKWLSTSRKRGRGRMQELNLRSLPTAPYNVSNAILPPPSSVENVVALT